MTKRELPKHVYRKKGGGLYFQRRGCTSIRLQHREGTPEFFAEYAAILSGRPAAPSGKTLKALAISYQMSDRYTTKAPRTRADYSKVLDYIKDKLGHLPADRMQRKDVIRARDSNSDATRFANYIVQVLSVMMEHAIDQGLRTDNPAKGVRQLKSNQPRRLPWPQDKIDAFRGAAPIGTRARLIFELCLGTGQRIGDVLEMRWNDIEGDGVNVRQNKTGAALWVPLTAGLRAVLAVTPKAGLTICAQKNGLPTNYSGAAGLVLTVRKQIGAEEYDLHALRHTAAAELAALGGVTDEMIQSITGHSSLAMVAHYSAATRQKARAKAVQAIREQNGSES